MKLPDPATVRAYAESVPKGFLFAVKVPNAITLTHFYAHQPKSHAEFANQPNPHFLSLDLLRRFLDSLSTVHGAEKLGPLLFQMPHIGDLLARYDPFTTDLTVVRLHGGDREEIEFCFAAKRESRGGRARAGTRSWSRSPSLVSPRNKSLQATAEIVRSRFAAKQKLSFRRETKAGARRGLVTFVYANNHYEGSAPLTIERLLAALAEKARPPR